MGFRFHKSFSLLPGIRLNLSRSGPSVSLGPKGARVNVGQKGIRTTVGVPGTGLSYVSQAGQTRRSKSQQGISTEESLAATAELMDGMSSEEKRALFLQMLAACPLPEVKRQKQLFERYVQDHPGEL